jgi:hypothetical protein
VLGQDLALVVAQVLLADGTHVPRFDGLGLHPVLARVGAPRPFALAGGHLEAPAQDLVDFMVEQRALPQERVLGRDAEDLEQHKEQVQARAVPLGLARALHAAPDLDLVLVVSRAPPASLSRSAAFRGPTGSGSGSGRAWVSLARGLLDDKRRGSDLLQHHHARGRDRGDQLVEPVGRLLPPRQWPGHSLKNQPFGP